MIFSNIKYSRIILYLGISMSVTLAGTSLSSGTQKAIILSVGDQLKSRIPGIFILFLSSRPND